MDKLEIIAAKNKLSEIQIFELRKVCCIYELQRENMRKGSFHEIKYNTYDLSYFANKIKEGKTPLEIMKNIINECDRYSTNQIIKKHFNNMKN